MASSAKRLRLNLVASGKPIVNGDVGGDRRASGPAAYPVAPSLYLVDAGMTCVKMRPLMPLS